MYKPNTVDQLITDSTNLLNFLKTQNINVDDGFQVVDIIQYLSDHYPNFNIHDDIKGEKYKDFIINVYEHMGIPEKFNGLDISLPYMTYNIRHGAYCSIIGMMSEYISLKVVLDNFEMGVINQSKDSQIRGEDITYYCNGNRVSADVKTSRVEYTDVESVTADSSWFNPNKKSVRIHLVDVFRGYHYITSRSTLHLMYERYGTEVPVQILQKYKHFYKHDITYITQSFI